MGAISGLDNHTTTGTVKVAVFGGGGTTLSFQDFQTDAAIADLHAYLTINGNLEKRMVDIGPLPQTSGSFEVSLNEVVDISLFNTVVIRSKEADVSVGSGRVP